MRASSAIAVLSLCAASLAIPARLDAQQPSACRRPSPSDHLRAEMEYWIASDDSRAVTFRREYKLPNLPPDSVLIVTDERICERAARARYRLPTGPLPLAGVEVLRVGDIYVVHTPAPPGGHWGALGFFTRDFEFTGGMLR